MVFLALDLGLFHRKAHVVGLTRRLVWAALALLFCLGLYSYAVWKFGATLKRAQASALHRTSADSSFCWIARLGNTMSEIELRTTT